MIKPNSKENKIIGNHGEQLKIAIKSAPVDGKANKMLVAFLAKHYKVSKEHVKILHGETSQHKLVEIRLLK